MNRLLKKVIAVFLVIAMTGANLSILGMYGIAYATTKTELAKQTTTTENSNVEFNSYFEDGGHTKTENIGKATKLLINVKVKNTGYLKNASISLQNTNFKIDGEINSNCVESVDKKNNEIRLKQLNNGSDVTIDIPISTLDEQKVQTDYFAKESKTKFTGTYVDGNGKEKSVSKEIINQLSWHGEAKGKLETELTKYIPYAIGEKSGVMLQTKINSSIVNGTLPIKNSEINVQVPEINGVKPTTVKVIANHTKASNGKADGLDFTQSNYTYDDKTGVVKIIESNAQNEASWLKNVTDEYLVTFIFENEEIYDEVTKNGIKTNMTTNAKIEVYNDKETIIEVPLVNTKIEATEKLGTMLDFEIAATNKLSKGQVYANYDSKVKKETEYVIHYGTVVSSSDLTDSIEISQSTDKFLNKENAEGLTTVNNKNYAYNKTIKISEKIFKKILGEKGSIDIYGSDEAKLGTINTETELQDGYYILDISKSDNNSFHMVTSKPVTEGKIVIDVVKALKTEIGYGKAQLKTFEKIQTEVEGKTDNSTIKHTSQIALEEVTSVAEVAISKTDLTTVVKNENVEIRATLDTSSIYNALYKNPVVKITLPSHISKIDIKKYDILMANGLKIKGTPKAETQKDGTIVITIELEGNGQEYTIDAEYKGTIIVLNTDITVKTLTPSNSNKITMEFTNDNDVSQNKKGSVEAKLNFVAPAGIVAANGILNFAQGKRGILSISDKSEVGTINAYSAKKIATVYGKVINNYGNSIENVVILGRLPVKDNKKLDEKDSLGSTFTASLNSNLTVKGIDSSKYTVYYSENVEAGTDFSNKNNGWSTTATTGTKSYMIVTKGYEMKTGEIVEFSYDIEIPANLKHNNESYQMYKVYYNNVSAIGKMAETKVSSIVGVSTGEGPELTANITSTVDTVREGQIVKMRVNVKNTGSVKAENVKVKIPLPENATFIEMSSGNGFYQQEEKEKVLNIGTLESGKSKQMSYYIKIDDYIKDEIPSEIEGEELPSTFPKEIINKAIITVDGLTGEIPSEEYKISIQEGTLALEMFSDMNESQVLKTGDVIRYIIDFKNISATGDLKNTVVTIPLPEGTTFKSAKVKENLASDTETTEGVSYNKETNTVQINIETISIQKTILLDVEVQEFEGNISIIAKAKPEGAEECYSNITEYVAEAIVLETTELTSTPKYVKEGENVTYTFKITNKGNARALNIRITDTLPSELSFVKATYTYAGEEQAVTNLKNGKLDITINQLAGGASITFNIIAKAKLLPSKEDKEVQNSVTIAADAFESITTNLVTNVIEYNQKIHDQNGGQKPVNPTEDRYRITGTAWLDSNKNGKRDADEQLLSNISVMLLNKSNNSIVKDPDTNKEKKTTTGSNGKYEFANLPKGEYIVIFLYDASRYSLTTYQEKDVDSSLNSDAININITMDGVRTIAGTTDVIKITNDNARDIDIGLYTSEKFDLKLDKYISKITRTTPTNGTNTYEYNNAKIAKIEVLGQNVGKSNIVIEYKIAVTNEGAIPGYVKKIVDYLPEGAGFNTELNKDWYLSENGNVYNASLANTIIQPGETKEVTLIVTKKITEESLRTPFINTAEIYESYNEQGLKDMDSTSGNKVQEEDDMSNADIYLGIVTGKIITYTGITLGVIAILGFGIFEIKKRVIDKKKV